MVVMVWGRQPLYWDDTRLGMLVTTVGMLANSGAVRFFTVGWLLGTKKTTLVHHCQEGAILSQCYFLSPVPLLMHSGTFCYLLWLSSWSCCCRSCKYQRPGNVHAVGPNETRLILHSNSGTEEGRRFSVCILCVFFLSSFRDFIIYCKTVDTDEIPQLFISALIKINNVDFVK